MTIQYYVGGKIVGLSSDIKPTLVPANTTFIESDTFTEFIFDGVATWNQIGLGPILPIGGWVEVGRTTLGASASTITISSLPNKRYYKILYADKSLSSTGADIFLRLNGDTAANYAIRRSKDGDADQTGVNQTLAFVYAGNTVQTPNFLVLYLSNLSSQEKLFMNHGMSQLAAGAGTPPQRVEMAGKWTNTSNAVSSITFLPSSGTFASGSEVVVLGWDPTDTHTDNFWEELASVDLSSGTASSISSGIFTAKKYIWIQYLIKGHTDVSSFDGYLRLGNTTIDSANNYSWRESSNGAADSTSGGSTNRILSQTGFLASGQIMFGNFFIINNASNGKLVTGNIGGGAASGAGTAPNRRESIGKWANTSNQLNIVELGRQGGSGSFATATTLKVWGSD